MLGFNSEPSLEVIERKTSTLKHSLTRKFSMGNLSVTIRPESPRTIQACKELGIDPSVLSQHKMIDSFGGPEVSFEIRNMRFQHYNKRMIQLILSVIRRKKLIKGKTVIIQEQNSVADSLVTSTTNNFLNKTTSSENMKNLPKKIAESFKKTVSYIKNSHFSPKLVSGQEIINDNSDAPDFDLKLQKEIDKFNETKRRKQKKAIMLYKEEQRKIEAKESWDMSVKRVDEITEKIKSEKEKKKEEAQKLFMEKREKAMETEKIFKMKIKNNRQSMTLKEKKKMDEREKELNEIREKKERKLKDILEKQKKREEKQSELLETDKAKWVDNIKRINIKLTKAEEIAIKFNDDKKNSMAEKLKEEEKILETYHHLQKADTEHKLNTYMDKVYQKKYAFETMEKKQMELKEEKEKEKKEKEERRNYVNKKNKSTEKSKKSTFFQRLERVEMKKLEILRDMERQRVLKIEEKRLKEVDQRENNDREKNKMELRIANMIDKDKRMKFKLDLERQKQEYLRQTRIEAALHARLEEERLEAGMNAVTYLMNDNRRSAPHLRRSEKIEKDIINEDYKKYQIAKCLLDENEFEEIKESLIAPIRKSRDSNDQDSQA